MLRVDPAQLTFPAGVVPGFSPNHIAAGGCRFSGIAAAGGGFTNLLTGSPGTLNGNPTSAIDGIVGQSFKTNSTAQSRDFTGQSTTNDGSLTAAFIIRPLVSNANQPAFASDSDNTTGGFQVGGSNPGKWLIQDLHGGTFKQSTISFVAGIPYFVAISCNSAVTNFVAKQLDTGQVLSNTTTGLTFTAPNGTYRVGAVGPNHLNNSSLAANMFSAQFLGMGELLYWAGDPWAFWYPQ